MRGITVYIEKTERVKVEGITTLPSEHLKRRDTDGGKTKEGTELKKKLLGSQYIQKTLGTVLSELGSQKKTKKIYQI